MSYAGRRQCCIGSDSSCPVVVHPDGCLNEDDWEFANLPSASDSLSEYQRSLYNGLRDVGNKLRMAVAGDG